MLPRLTSFISELWPASISEKNLNLDVSAFPFGPYSVTIVSSLRHWSVLEMNGSILDSYCCVQDLCIGLVITGECGQADGTFVQTCLLSKML